MSARPPTSPGIPPPDHHNSRGVNENGHVSWTPPPPPCLWTATTPAYSTNRKRYSYSRKKVPQAEQVLLTLVLRQHSSRGAAQRTCTQGAPVSGLATAYIHPLQLPTARAGGQHQVGRRTKRLPCIRGKRGVGRSNRPLEQLTNSTHNPTRDRNSHHETLQAPKKQKNTKLKKGENTIAQG